MSEILTANFARRFPAGPVISVADLVAGPGPTISVLFGPSGAGKTTVLRCLAGLERPDSGIIRFGAETWYASGPTSWLAPNQRQVGYVPQDYALFPHMTAAWNIGYGLGRRGAGARDARVRELTRWLNLEGLEQRLPNELSGGQQQRVALARAVAPKPRLLLLDEPLAALDSPTRVRLRGELGRMLKGLGIPTILVTHDRADALALGDQIVVMDHGSIAQQGPVPEVFSRPASAAVAQIVGVETVLAGQFVDRHAGLARVRVGAVTLQGLAADLPPNADAVYVCIRAEDVILVAEGVGHSSPRNRLAARVVACQPEHSMLRVELDCGFPLAALLTPQAVEELGAREGATLTALIKVPNIHIIPRSSTAGTPNPPQ